MLRLRRWALLLLSPLVLACGVDELVPTDLGDAPPCAGVDLWPVLSVYHEEELLDAIEALRLTGAECDGTTVDGEGPVELVPELRCAARMHAGDLIRHPELEVDHEGSNGSSALSRANAAGYGGIARQELLAGDFVTAEALVDAWRDEEDHCRAILDRDLDHVGIGHAQTREGDRIVWVVVTGQERR